jgi:hypothetical protein
MASILGYPKLDETFISMDVSSVRVDSMLSQVHEGWECVVTSYSRTLLNAERNCCVT